MNMPNPYMERMNQLQNYQQSLQQPVQQIPQAQGLVGKMVNDVSVVSPNDVPMDGNVAIFPKNDMSEIYCKQWKQDGTIQTVVYKPAMPENSQDGIENLSWRKVADYIGGGNTEDSIKKAFYRFIDEK